LLLAGAALVLKTYRDAGEFKTIKSHFKGKEKLVSGVSSSEDITIDPRTGMAFISSDDRRPWFHGGKGQQGAVYGYNLTSPSPRLLNLTRDFRKDLHPHGIGLYIAKNGTSSLFVVNHSGKGHFVEIFDFDGEKLSHRASISGDLMSSPNDVLPVGPKKFYVTNDHGNRSKFGKALEDYLQLPRAYVLYFDGTKFQKVAHDLKYANGINMSGDGRTVYVASTTGHSVFLYDRNPGNGSLVLKRKIDLGTGPDNIEMDEKGRLWIGAHAKLLTFVKYAKDPGRRSPSQVLRITLHSRGNDLVEEVYLNTGDPLSGSSVAAYYKSTLLIGSVFDPHFLVCTMEE
jgi:arylesterase/paraoxonase